MPRSESDAAKRRQVHRHAELNGSGDRIRNAVEDSTGWKRRAVADGNTTRNRTQQPGGAITL